VTQSDTVAYMLFLVGWLWKRVVFGVMRPRVRRRGWVFPTVLYDFRLRSEGSPYLPAFLRDRLSIAPPCGRNEDSRVQMS